MTDNRLSMLIDPQDVEPGAMKQIEEALEHPWMKRLAIMPDVHRGYDLPIGAVALTEGIISPSFVGGDIGCGMTLYYTGYVAEELGLDTREGRERIFKALKRTIPMGKGIGHPQSSLPTRPLGCRRFTSHLAAGHKLNDKVNAKLASQFGTLGSGNHFIEIGLSRTGLQKGNAGREVCITIHSGSRRPGWEIAKEYMGGKDQKTYLPLDSERGQAYVADMMWATDFALQSRLAMMNAAVDVLLGSNAMNPLPAGACINENHNFAEVRPDGTVLHRKGATPAMLGQPGVIPGSMATGVCVTEGMGNWDYLCSASHGAGRVMSRTKAKKSITMDAFTEAMAGITADVNPDLLDEAPQAYKDIGWVIRQQEGVVVAVLDDIRPIINVKGA